MSASRRRSTIRLLESRRLTGPNLAWDLPGAVIQVAADAGAKRLLFTECAGTTVGTLNISVSGTIMDLELSFNGSTTSSLRYLSFAFVSLTGTSVVIHLAMIHFSRFP